MKFAVIMQKFVIVICIALMASFFVYQPVSASETSGAQRIAGEVLVKLKGSDDIERIAVDDVDAAVEKYKNNPFVEIVEPNYIFESSFLPNDAAYVEQWYYERLRSEEAWEISQGDGVVVAVLDTGVFTDHPELRDRLWVNQGEIPGDGIDNDRNGIVDDYNGYDFADRFASPDPKTDSTGYFTRVGIHHGTVVSGLVGAAGNNSKGITGSAFLSKIMAVRVLNSHGFGDTAKVVSGIQYAADMGADVINMSFFGFADSTLINQAIQYAHDKGVIVVAAAGNSLDGQDLNTQPGSPICALSGSNVNYVLGVGATDAIDNRASFSNYGSDCVDISAPGVDIYSTQYVDGELGLRNLYGNDWSGTSFATPLVSGTAALIKAVAPGLSNDEIVDLLINNVADLNIQNLIHVGEMGSGVLDMAAALEAIPEENRQLTRLVHREDVNMLLDEQQDANPTDTIVATPVETVADANGVQLLMVPAKDQDSDVYVFSMPDMELLRSFEAYPFQFEGGIFAASANLSNGLDNEIVVAPGIGGGPMIRVFSSSGSVLSQFFVYEESFRGGLNMATADLDGNGIDEIIVAPGPGRVPMIRILDKDGNLIREFLAYDEGFRGGVNVRVFEEFPGIARIVTSVENGNPHVRMFDEFGEPTTGGFFAFEDNTSGVAFGGGDWDADGRAELVTVPHSDEQINANIYNFDSELESSITLRGIDGANSILFGSFIRDDIAEILVTLPEAKVVVFDLLGNAIKEFNELPFGLSEGARARFVK